MAWRRARRWHIFLQDYALREHRIVAVHVILFQICENRFWVELWVAEKLRTMTFDQFHPADVYHPAHVLVLAPLIACAPAKWLKIQEQIKRECERRSDTNKKNAKLAFKSRTGAKQGAEPPPAPKRGRGRPRKVLQAAE